MKQGSRLRGLDTSADEQKEGPASDALAGPSFAYCPHRRPFGTPPDEPCRRCLEAGLWSCPADGTHPL
jgi:hypothetical protein